MFRLYILVAVLFFTTIDEGNAAHIVGGDVTYKCVSTNEAAQSTRFLITFTMYRDVLGGGAFFDAPASFGVYTNSGPGSSWIATQVIMQRPANIEEIAYDDKCVVVPPNIVIEKGTYQFEVDIPWSNKITQIAYQRCCRNNTINNIVSPETTGAVFSVEIQDFAVRNCNNSPVFNNFPPILVCSAKPVDFDHSATDSEGDVLVYEFCTPLTGGGTDGATTPGSPTSCTGVTPSPANCRPPFAQVQYSAPFSGTNPMGGNPVVNINSNSGFISGVPNTLGQYVVGVCVKEFRNGQLIGSIRRDFQFNVVVCQGINTNSNYTLCSGDSITINNTTYNQTGSYSQLLQSSQGCDSTLNIDIYVRPLAESIFDLTVCEGQPFELNGEIYTKGGQYKQVIENGYGCDSTIVLNINELARSESSMSIQICDDELAIVNDQVYASSGNYVQTISNLAGCDSTIFIKVVKGTSYVTSLVYSLCDKKSINVNNVSYTTAGDYVQNYVTTNGCDSSFYIKIYPCDLNITYDLETCNALIPEASMDYTEFTPKYVNPLVCGSIISSNIYREDPQLNKHSCTPGNNSALAMCVSASKSCDPAQADAKPIVIEVMVNPAAGTITSFNHLTFFQNSPLTYDWISGNKGKNNYPTKYAVRITKDGIEIFYKKDIPAKNGWSGEKFDFFTENLFKSSDSVKYVIELTPYCQIGNGETVSVWDIDDVGLYFSCEEIENRVIQGEVSGLASGKADIKIRRIDGVKMIETSLNEDGSFVFPRNNPKVEYKLIGIKDTDHNNGISALDYNMIKQHILGVKTFKNPLQYIAADITRDRKITAADLFELHSVVIGFRDKFKKNTSYLMLNDAQCTDDAVPFEINDYISILPGTLDIKDIKFRMIKVGDVSGLQK